MILKKCVILKTLKLDHQYWPTLKIWLENKTIYYYYDPHEDDAIINDSDKKGRQYITESVFDFIAKLIVHIPEKKFILQDTMFFMLITHL